MSVPSWFHRQITWPVLQNLAAGAVGAGVLLAGQQSATLTGGCSPGVVQELTSGEAALAAGDWAKAHAIAADAGAEAPNCKWANTFSAAVSLEHMRQVAQAPDDPAREQDRLDCFENALKARPLFTQDPRVNALLLTCRATTRL